MTSPKQSVSSKDERGEYDCGENSEDGNAARLVGVPAVQIIRFKQIHRTF
jgi:hypothetical protein